MGLFGLGGPKKEPVRGRLMFQGAAPPPGCGFAYTLLFVKAGPRQPPSSATLDTVREDEVSAHVTVVSLVDPSFEVALPPGHYQVLARGRLCELQGTELAVDEAFFDESPLPAAFEVKAGHGALVNLAVRPKAAAPAGQGATPDAVTVVWASDDRLHGRELSPQSAPTDHARIPPAARGAWKRATELGNAGDNEGALAAYGVALSELPAEARAAAPDFFIDAQLGGAKCLVDLGRHREACAVLSQVLAPGKALPPVPRLMAADLLFVFGIGLARLGHVEQADRCLVLGVSLAMPSPNRDFAIGLITSGRKRCLEALAATAAPERLLETLDKQSLLFGAAEGDFLGAGLRFDALVKLGRVGAARTFGRRAVAEMRSQQAPDLAAELEQKLAALPPGAGRDLSPSIHAAAAEARSLEHAMGERLAQAAERGDISALTRLAQGPMGVNALGEQFRTALMMAAFRGQADALRWLLDHGAVVDLTTIESRSALMLAADEGHADCIRLLLEKGAAIDLQDQALQTALHLASWQNHVAAVRVLLEHRASVTVRDVTDATPLQLACTEDVPETVALLLAAGSAVNHATRLGTTPLMAAAMEGHARVVEVLLKAGADRSARDANGRTARMWAEQERHHAVARLL